MSVTTYETTIGEKIPTIFPIVLPIANRVPAKFGAKSM